MNSNSWQVRIRITQIPGEIETESLWDYIAKKEVIAKKSLFTNPFYDQTTYGLELALNNDFSWTFFFNERDKEKALVKGFSYLNYLETEFVGLTGKIEVVPVDELQLAQHSILYELVIPHKPIPFLLISKIIHLFKKERIGNLSFYIFWERNDAYSTILSDYDGLLEEYYKLKIYIRVDPYFVKNTDKPVANAIFKGMMEYLTFNIRDPFSVRACIEPRSLDIWNDIIGSKVLIDNPEKKVTGSFYSKWWNEIPKNKRCSFVYPALLDFSFPDNCPIRTANVLKTSNLEYRGVSKEDKNSIWIGQIMSNGIVESNPATISIDHFGKSVFIGGQIGSGKTRLLTQISREFYKKAPHIGILYLNVGKANQEYLYAHDTCIKYGNPELKIPYFMEGEYRNKSIQESAAYLAASLGLREPVDKILIKIMKSFIRVNGTLPLSLQKLFKGLRKWYKTHRYDDKFQARITTAIENRVLSLLSDPILEQCTQLAPDGSIPQWFLDWWDGKKVYIDISMCDAYVKLLLTNAIFQMIRALTPDYEMEGVHHLIVIDEAHVILEKSKEQFTNSDFYVAKEQLETIFNRLLREFRSKGLGFIISDVTPSDLFVAATKLPSLKILFRMGEECIRRFTHMAEDHRYLLLLKTRQALVLNGNNSDRFSIKTITVKTKTVRPVVLQNM